MITVTCMEPYSRDGTDPLWLSDPLFFRFGEPELGRTSEADCAPSQNADAERQGD